jgi:hypothetical protein
MNTRDGFEDWLTELPPLDGGDEETAASDDEADEFVTDDQDAASLDDAAADDLDVDEDVEITEEESADDDDDVAWHPDVGEPELDVSDGEQSSVDDGVAEASSEGDGEFDIDDEVPSSEDDAGEEGTTDPIEHSLDEDLPALDADDDGDFEDSMLLEVGNLAASKGSSPWAEAQWEERAGLSRSFAWPVDDADEVVAMRMIVAPSSELVAATTDSDILIESAGEAKIAVPLRAARPPVGERGPWLVALAAASAPVLWAATRAGELAKSGDFGATWARCAAVARPILAIAARDDGSISLLVRKADAIEILTSSDGSRWFAQRISADVDAREQASLWMVHRGAAAAIGDKGGVCIARDGRQFTRVPGSAGATAGVFAGRAADAPLILAGGFEQDDGAVHLLRVAADGRSEIIARVTSLGDGEDEPSVLALAWHDATETLRVVFPNCVSTWGPKKSDLV